jgi:hypothetical protein
MAPRFPLSLSAFLLPLAFMSGCLTRAASEGPRARETTPAADAAAATDAMAPDAVLIEITVPDSGAVDGADPDAGSLASTADGVAEEPKLPPPAGAIVGAVCQVNSDCQTGSCVDGVCCSSAACGVCHSCAVPGALGACSPLPALSEDPKNSCVGTLACDGKGTCALANGNACKGAGDCISGFCVDGVCCESACDQTCFSCNTVFQFRGTCQPLGGGTDDNAAAPCSGAKACTAGASAVEPLCLLVDGQPCAAPSDCVSGECSTFYADRDGDKYGNGASAISICGPSDAPPLGYVATAGDCCDADGRAHPGETTSFSTPDECGSWDYNCDGYVEEQFTTGPCGGSAGPAACGKTCVREVLGSPITSYTQACR